jgi:hypothetical protein
VRIRRASAPTAYSNNPASPTGSRFFGLANATSIFPFNRIAVAFVFALSSVVFAFESSSAFLLSSFAEGGGSAFALALTFAFAFAFALAFAFAFVFAFVYVLQD